MKGPPIPLEVQAWLAPVLSLVQGLGSLRSRPSLLWGLEEESSRKREEMWLGARFPNHSEDSLADAIERILQLGGMKGAGAAGRSFRRHWRSVQPEATPNLVKLFAELGDRYLRWSGNRLMIRAGRLEELHHVALEFPVSQLARHLHARSVARSGFGIGEMLDHPSWIGHIPTENSHLRGVVDRGLHEGHLHLKGQTSAEGMWAHHLLAGAASAAVKNDPAGRGRILGRCSRIVFRLAVISLLFFDRAQASDGEGVAVGGYGLLGLNQLLDRLDDVLAATVRSGQLLEIGELERDLRNLVHQTWRETRPSAAGPFLGPKGVDLARFLLAPEKRWLSHGTRSRRAWPLLVDSPLPTAGFRQRTDFEKRARAVEWVHLELHRLLLSLPSGRPGYRQRRDRRRSDAWSSPQQALERNLERFVDRVFFRYLTLQTYHLQLGTQHGSRMGLSRFRDYFSASQRKPVGLDEREVARMFMTGLHLQPQIHAIEGRVSPSPQGRETIRPWLEAFARRHEPTPRAGSDRLGFGLVVHFVKSRERSHWNRRRSLLAREAVVRHRNSRMRVRSEALDLFRFLRRLDPQVPFLVGIDSCNLELAVPPEVFAPAFRFLRAEPIAPQEPGLLLGGVLGRRSFHHLTSVRHLGMTYHVGEDFRHLLSGLRAVDEAIRFLGARPGDRLGHAIAVGVDPERWAELVARQVYVPRQEWLDDLVWLRHLLGPGTDLLQFLRIDDKIQSLLAAIYGEAIHGESSSEKYWPQPLDLHHAWLLRELDPEHLKLPLRVHEEGRAPRRRDAARYFQERLRADEGEQRWQDVQKRRHLRFFEENGPHPAVYDLHRAYLYDSSVRRKGAELVNVKIDEDWLRVCEEAQKILRRRLHDRHVIVEMNPMSNCAVGPMTSLEEHHVFRLSRDGEPVLQATVNTDDPGVFQTSLAHEFYLLGESLLREKIDESEVADWLDALRRSGEAHSFLRQTRELGAEESAMLLEDLRRLYSRKSETRRRWLGEPAVD